VAGKWQRAVTLENPANPAGAVPRSRGPSENL
jgi:hypothetical protein